MVHRYLLLFLLFGIVLTPNGMATEMPETPNQLQWVTDEIDRVENQMNFEVRDLEKKMSDMNLRLSRLSLGLGEISAIREDIDAKYKKIL